MADVVVDINKLNETVRAYSTYRLELTYTLGSLKAAVESIQNQWKGEARNSFTVSHFPKLYSSMQEHIKKVERLEQELSQVSKDFSSLESDLKSKSF